MIYDRPYMRSDYPGSPQGIKNRPWFWYLLISIGVGFVLQKLIGNWLAPGFTLEWVALTPWNLGQGKVWTLLTYGWLHVNFFHVFLNLLIAGLVGRGLLQVWGQVRLTRLFVLSIFVGGMVWSLLHLWRGTLPVVGASAGVGALLALICYMHWNQKITINFFFFLPVTLSGKFMFLILVGLDALFFLLEELPYALGRRVESIGNVAYSAHLGGALMAWFFWKQSQVPGWWRAYLPKTWQRSVTTERPLWRKKTALESPKYRVNVSSKANGKDIDAILDKITQKGFGALSEAERETLDRAHKDRQR